MLWINRLGDNFTFSVVEIFSIKSNLLMRVIKRYLQPVYLVTETKYYRNI